MATINEKLIDGEGLSILNDVFNSRLSAKADTDSIPTWAMQSTKPTYTATEVGAIPSSTLDTLAKKSDITNVYKYKGSVATYSALPTTNLTAGDVYNVETDNMNYAWTGSAWDPLGAAFTVETLSEAEIKQILGVS